MTDIAIVYWSGTGNTEAMANLVAEGIKDAGKDVDIISAESFSAADMSRYTRLAFGCPSMGDEVLEEEVFEPMFAEIEGSLGGKTVGLFGSYGWGDGQWMRSWEKDCDDAGLNLVCESVICAEAPDETALEACRALGKALAA